MDYEQEMILKYSPLVRGTATVYAGRYGLERDDLIQEGYLALLLALRSFDPERRVPLGAYLKAKVGQALWGYCRRSLSGKETPTEDSQFSHLLGVVDLEQDNKYLWAEVLGCLSEKQRRVVYLTYFADQSLEEIGRQMGVTAQAVCRLKSRALKNLQQVLIEGVE
jgi:RNA polymerase sigma factor (sigma-70 family)